MKANRITAHLCLIISAIALLFMFFLSNQGIHNLVYDIFLAVFGSALLSFVVAYLSYKNQVRDIKIYLFSELLNGYRAYAAFFDSYSDGTPNIDKAHSDAYDALGNFFAKYSLYAALLGSNNGILDQLQQAAKLLHMLNGDAILLTKLSHLNDEFFEQIKATKNILSQLEQKLVESGKKIISKSFGISSTYSMDVY